jgi:hypothetical protein
MRSIRIVLFAAFLGVLSVVSAAAQGAGFTDPNAEYSFDIPDAKWKMTVKPTATSPSVEYVYGDRTDGHVEVRKLTVAKDALLSDVIRTEEQKLQFVPGYVAGRQESFRGRLSGAVFNFEFVRAGRPMSGRYYFLKADDTTIYVLRFSGFTDKLRSIRNQTDSIARTFAIKNP